MKNEKDPVVKDPYLIQRCKALEYKDTLKTGDYLRLDYMGAAEFEFGAIPKFQHAVNGRLADMEIFSCTHKDITLYYLVDLSRSETYAEAIKGLIEGKFRLKGRMGLEDRETNHDAKPSKRVYNDPKMPFQFDTWFDLGNNVVIARHPQILKNLKRTIPNSVKYMDSQR